MSRKLLDSVNIITHVKIIDDIKFRFWYYHTTGLDMFV